MKAIKVMKKAENFAFLHFTARLIMPCAKFLGAAFPGALAAAIFCAAALGALFISCEQPDSFGSFFYYEKGLRAPGGVKAVAGNGLVTLSWLPVGALITEEYEYEVFYNTSNSIPAAPFWTGRNFTTIVSPLTNRTAYYFWVRAVMGGKKGDFSEPVKAIPWPAGTAPDTPAAPRIITGIERLTVVWEITGGAAQYEVYYSTSAAAPASPAQTVSATSATINGLSNGQIYYFWIKAKNGSLVSVLSQPQTGIPRAATSPPGVPGKPELESGSGKMSLRWNPAEMASVYEVYYSTNQERSSSPAVSGLGETSATVSGLQNGQRYYFWVRATNGLGAGGFSPSASGTPSAFAEAPAAPAAPSVTPGSGRLFVSWQAAEGALSYELWWGTTDNSAGAVKYGSDFSGTSAEVSCDNGVTRYFWLKAKNEKGASGFGACANGTPSAIYAPPAAPAAPVVTAGNGQLTLNWTAIEGAQAYELWLGTTNNSAEAGRRADVAATSAVISGLTNNTVYYIWLKAKNAAGSSGFSLRSSGTPQASLGPPQTPGQPALALGSGQFTVSWNAVEGADAYEVYLGTSAEFASAAKNGGDVTTLSKTISGLTNGTTYYVWVKAKNGLGASAESTSRSAIPIAAASAPTVTAENTRLTLAWTAVAGASQYEVYYSTGTTIPAAPAQTVTSTSATISGLTNGTTYNVWVKPKNATGAGAASARASGKPTTAALYKGATYASATKIGVYNVADALAYISSHVVVDDNYFIVMGENETLAPQTLSYSNKTVGITLMADGVERTLQLASTGRLFTIKHGVTFTLEANVTLRGITENYASLVYIQTGNFTMNGGTISGNNTNTNNDGGGVTVNSSCTFTMNSGTISGNTASGSSSSGGIYVYNGGTFTMNGGTISGNTASTRGGGVALNGGMFTMNGGTVRNNTTSSYGGGVYAISSGTFTMNGGTISGNTAGNGGGGVFVSIVSAFTMSGGTISGNTANGYGGGVYVQTGNTFTKTNGVITGYGNDTVNGNKVQISGGTIQSNKGHAVFFSGSKHLENTVTAGHNLDTAQDGAAGGWVE